MTADETTPLVAAVPAPAARRRWQLPAIALTTRQRATFVAFTAIFLVEIAALTMVAGVSSMLEAVLCRQITGVSDLALLGPDPAACKTPPVQRQLSTMRGWQTALDCVPAILFTVPYGILADRIGRRPVLLLAWLGLVLSVAWYCIVFYFTPALPLWTFYLGSLFACIGTFSSVGPAITYTVLADVTPQADRASVYFRVNAALLVAELLGTPLCGALLLLGNWPTMLVSLAVSIASMAVLLLLPETLGYKDVQDEAAQADPLAAGDDGDADAYTSPDTADGRPTVWQQAVGQLRYEAATVWRFALLNRRLMLLMSSFVFFAVGRFVQDLLLQYATKRYHWSWSRAAFLLTIRSTSNLLYFLVALPAASAFCLRRLRMHPLAKDLALARLCGALGILGALLIAFAATPALLSAALVVFSMGAGFSSLIRSLLSAFVEAHHQAMLNSLLGLLEFAGLMVTGPLLFQALQAGLELGGVWVGLPFMCAAVLLSASTGIVLVFRVPAAMLDREEAEA